MGKIWKALPSRKFKDQQRINYDIFTSETFHFCCRTLLPTLLLRLPDTEISLRRRLSDFHGNMQRDTQVVQEPVRQ